ncbi:MAG TPA: MFS transporter [Pelotomaculum sp.]|nr:MFS transporter [Pelotomaculum sp.]
MVNDWYGNYLQTLLPFLVASGCMVSRGAFLISMFTITSSMIQPFTGYLVDKKNKGWLVYIGTFWMGALLSLVGVIKSYPLLLMTVIISGLGTAAFHPSAAVLVSSYSGERKGFCQAIFTAAGNIGYAFTPILIVPVVQKYGMNSTIVFIIPGIMAAILLLFATPRAPVSQKAAAAPPAWPILQKAGPQLIRIIVMVAFRSFCYFGLVAFLPLYYQQQNISLIAGSHYLSLMLFAGAVGGLIGGYISDIIGRKPVIVDSLILATPLLYLYLNSSGALSYFLVILAGTFLLSSFSVTVVLAQDILKENKAMASGLMLGFTIGLGGLGVGLIGLLVEYWGINTIIHLLVLFPLLAGLIGITINDDYHKRARKPKRLLLQGD